MEIDRWVIIEEFESLIFNNLGVRPPIHLKRGVKKSPSGDLGANSEKVL